MKIHALIHAPFETVGIINHWCQLRGHTLRETHSYRGEQLPHESEFDFLIVMGGPQSVIHIDEYPYLLPEVQLIQRAFMDQKWILGICLGAQLIAYALGANAEKNSVSEIGVFPITLTAEGKKDKVLQHFPERMLATHWHGDMPGLPQGAKVLASSDACPRQAIAFGARCYGLQFHWEVGLQDIEGLIQHSGDDLTPSTFIQSAEQLRQHNYAEINQYMLQFLDSFISSTEHNRYTQRAQDYRSYRPGYEQNIYEYFQKELQLQSTHIIADIATGTGQLAQLFLNNQHSVYAVEPNDDMRQQAELALSQCPKFVSVKGSAEQTTLPDNSVDVITVATAFHWFNPQLTKQEFQRILKPRGHVVLLWQFWQHGGTPFLQALDNLLSDYSAEYKASLRKYFDRDKLATFFQPATMHTHITTKSQHFNLADLQGLMRTLSLMPLPGENKYESFQHTLGKVFDRFAVDDQVEIIYECVVYWARWD